MPNYDFSVTVSSIVGGAWLEVRRRSNFQIELTDILARLLPPGLNNTQARNFRDEPILQAQRQFIEN